MNRFFGDPAVSITQDGADMTFIGGQPVMDAGLENAAQISLFTRQGWWGNTLMTGEAQQIGSDFQSVSEQPIVNITSINNVINAAERSLAWMIGTLASAVNVTATNTTANRINTRVVIDPPGRDSQTLLFLSNGLSWIRQATHPAHKRLQ